MKKEYGNSRTRGALVDAVADDSDGGLIELVILCECVRLEDDLVVVWDVFSRVASASDFTFCFIASVGSTYHLKKQFSCIQLK